MRHINIYIYILHWVLGLQFVFRWEIELKFGISKMDTLNLLFPKIFQKRNLDDFSDVYLVKTYFVVKNFLRKQNNGWPHLRCCDVQMLR